MPECTFCRNWIDDAEPLYFVGDKPACEDCRLFDIDDIEEDDSQYDDEEDYWYDDCQDCPYSRKTQVRRFLLCIACLLFAIAAGISLAHGLFGLAAICYLMHLVSIVSAKWRR